MGNLISIQKNNLGIKGLIPFLAFFSTSSYGQPAMQKLYPFCYESKQEVVSPHFINDTVETILVVTKDNKYGIAPVTVENGEPLLYSYKTGIHLGKDQQLLVNDGDFPELAKNGLHSEDRLDITTAITGIPVSVINCTGRPNAYSTSGFMAEDEDLISILRNDNRTVQKLGLTHSQLARPLYHIWNLILLEYELGNWGRYYDKVKNIWYNDNILNLKASGTKGWQISIFMDEIQGMHEIHIDRELTDKEEKFLKEKYSFLEHDKMEGLISRLTNLDFSEMLPYYIMRYGFYEGHSGFRTDPVSIAFIFGLKSIEEIDKEFGQLYNTLFDHFHL